MIKNKETPITPDTDIMVLNKNKQNGHKRDVPQTSSIVQGENNITVNLEAQMESLKVTDSYCGKCQEDFLSKVDLQNHMKIKHSLQWNCNQCDFQATTRSILMDHCKMTRGHTPSKQRLGESGVVECFTCCSEFRSYHDLMNHRK